METDNPRLTFKVEVQSVRFGDRKQFHQYTILTHQGGKVVGIEQGPNRKSKTLAAAIKAANLRIDELKSHRLFIVRVTSADIREGNGRDCYNCAISLALERNQERMGIDPFDYLFKVSPYAAWVEAEGIVLHKKLSSEEDLSIEPWRLPDVVIAYRRDGQLKQWNCSMVEWAQEFDDWTDLRSESLKEWREERGYDNGERPYRPSPCSFVLDLDAFKPPSSAPAE